MIACTAYCVCGLAETVTTFRSTSICVKLWFALNCSHQKFRRSLAESGHRMRSAVNEQGKRTRMQD